DVANYVKCWFPVIELHNCVFRAPAPTCQELVAANALHAGFVVPDLTMQHDLERLLHGQIRVELNGETVVTEKLATLWDGRGPLGSIRRLASSLRDTGEKLLSNHIILTGSPGPLIPVNAGSVASVICESLRVDLHVEPEGGRPMS